MRFRFSPGCMALLFIIFSVNTYALESGNQEIEFEITQSFASRHICEAQDSFAANDPIWETALDVALKEITENTDLALGIWWGYPLKSGNVSAEEIDYAIELSRNITDSLDLSLGYSYIDFPKANRNSDFNKLFTTLALDEIPDLPLKISPHIYAAYQFEAAAEGPEDGWYYSWGFNTEFSLPDLRIFQKDQSINLDITNWGTDGVAGIKSNSFYASEYSLSTDYRLFGFTITPSVNYVASYDDDINEEDEFWARVDLSYSF